MKVKNKRCKPMKQFFLLWFLFFFCFCTIDYTVVNNVPNAYYYYCDYKNCDDDYYYNYYGDY